MNIVQAPAKFLSADLLARFIAIVGDKHAITDPQAQAPYLLEMRDMFHGHTPVVLRPGSVAEVADILKLANETSTPIVPQGGNTGLVGRADRPARRDRALAQPPRSHSRGRSRFQHHDLRGRRDAAARARGGGAGGPALSATAALGGDLHHRRQSLDQCRRHRRARPWHRALACARHRSRACGRTRAAQPQQAQEGQHRLRSQEPVHRRRRNARRDHRRGAATGAAAARGRDGLRRRALAGGGPRPARTCDRAHRGRRHQLRADAAARDRAGASPRRGLSRSASGEAPLVRADRTFVPGPLRFARGDGGDPGRGPGARPHRGRHHRRQSRAGQNVLAHPRTVRRGATA